MKRLENKRALITGGARGIGYAIAEAFVAEGAVLTIADIDSDNATSSAITLGENTTAVTLDVTEQNSIANAMQHCKNDGGLDILVNCAAIFDLAPLGDISEQSYERVFAVNVKGTLFMMQAAADLMITQGRGGKIINLASQAGRRGEALVSVYCASKAAVISLTQSAGLGLIKHGINVNAISPGVVDTPMWDEVDALFSKYENRPIGEKKTQVGNSVPFGRMGRPDDHAGAALFLASSESDYVVAQTLNVDGGNWMS